MSTIADTAGARIRRFRKERKATLDEVAEKVGISGVHLGRIERNTFRVSVELLSRIAEALGRDPRELVETPLAGRITVKGAVEAGRWRDREQWDEAEWYSVAVPVKPEWQGLDLQAAEVRGESMNRVYPPGTVIVWAPQWQLREQPRDGRRYVLRAVAKDGSVEMTVKKYRKDAQGKAWLQPESDDPGHSAALNFSESTHERVEVVGRVLASIRHEEE